MSTRERVYISHTNLHPLYLQKEIFRAHKDSVTSICWASHGTQVVTGSLDSKAILWNAETSEVLSELEGHQKGIYDVDWSPDCNFVSTASTDCTARLWDVGSGLELHSYIPPSRSIVWSTSFTNDGESLLVGYADGNARLWHVEEGVVVNTLQGHTSWVVDCKCSPEDINQFATASKDGSAIIWDGRANNKNACIASKVPLLCLDWSPDGKYIVTGSKDCKVRIWDTRKAAEREAVKELTPLPYDVLSCSWSPLGSYIAITCSDDFVRVYDADYGAKIQKFQGHQGSITCSQWAPNGLYLATGSADNTGKIWNIDELELEGNNSPREEIGNYDSKKDVSYLKRSSEELEFQSATIGIERDTEILGEGADSKAEAVGPNFEEGVVEEEFAFLGRARKLSLSASARSSPNLDVLEEFRLQLGNSERYNNEQILHKRKLYSFSGNDCSWLCKEQFDLETARGVMHCTLSGDSTRIAATCKDKRILIFQQDSSGDYIRDGQLEGLLCTPSCFAFAPDNVRGVSGHHEGVIMFWDTKKLECKFMLGGHTGTVSCISWIPGGGDLFLSSSYDFTSIVWDVKMKLPKWKLVGHTSYIRSSLPSPNGQLVVTASSDNSAIIWSLKSGTLMKSFQKHSSTVYVAAWSPDSTRVATACRDGIIYIWNAFSMENVQLLKCHKSEVRSLAWSPKGDLLLSGSWDGKVNFWNPDDGCLLHIAQIHSGAVKSLMFSENGEIFVSASLDASMRIFQVSTVSSNKEFFGQCEKVLALHERDHNQVTLILKYLKDCMQGGADGESEAQQQKQLQIVLQVVQSALENVHMTMESMAAIEEVGGKFGFVSETLVQSLSGLKKCILQLNATRG